MSIFIITIGVLIMLTGLLTILKPKFVFGFLQNNLDKPALRWGAILGRLVMGALLVIASDHSRFPQTFELIGWFIILAGIGLAVIGGQKFRRLASWALSKANAYARFIGTLVAVFGGFLAYAFS